MGEVHQFPFPPRLAADPGATGRRQLAESIRQEISKGTRRHTDAAKEAAAELWRLFEERGRDFKRKVCQMVWGAKHAKPTKHLYGLVWDPQQGQPKAKTARKPAALTIYLRLAEAVAKVAGEDEDDVILRVFPNLLGGPRAFASRDFGPAEQLRETFWSEWLAVNERIASDCDLRRAFPVAMELPGFAFGTYQRFRLDHGQLLGGEHTRLPEYSRSWFGYQQYGSPRDFLLGVAPSLFLGECHGPSFRAKVVALDGAGEPGDAAPTLTAWVRVWLRFWWAILPIGTDGAPRGCFVVSLMTERSPSLWSVSSLDEADSRYRDDEEEYRPRPAPPWIRVLSASGARSEGHWTNRHLWNERNHHGLVLSWDCEEASVRFSDGAAGRYRCTAELDPGTREVLMQFFGCSPEDLPPTPARILPASAGWRDVIFSLPDGALADWVGPDPDALHSRPPQQKEVRADMSDEEKAEIEFENGEAFDDWCRDEIAYQQRGLGLGTRTAEDIQVFGVQRVGETTYQETIGSKFEKSLLLLPEGDRPDITLLTQAEELRDHAAQTLGKINGELRKNMAALGRRTPKGRSL
jgi:hypothetical protein